MSEMLERLGHYRIERKLGAGGQADVYKAFDDRLQRPVALKVLVVDTASADARMRFDREAKATAKLKHPHIVTIFDVGSEDKYLYYAMEVLPGGDLKAKMQQGLSHLEVIDILLEVCDALAFAHSKGFVHRDLKPENVLFNEHGRAVVTDLGIAKYSDETKTRGVLGTPYYMSPEQVRGEVVDGRSDLYSLGAMLYRMLTKENLFEGDDSLSICNKHIHAQPQPLPTSVYAFQPLLDRLLAKDPNHRWPDARVVMTQLRLLQSQLNGNQPTAAYLADDTPRVPRTLPRRIADVPAAWRTSALVSLGVVAAVAVFFTARLFLSTADSNGSNVSPQNLSSDKQPADDGSQPRSARNAIPSDDRGDRGAPTNRTAALPSGRALLQLESEPAGATVMFRDRSLGITPLLLERLPPGRQSITVKRKFFAPEVINVTLTDDVVVKQRVVLAPGSGDLTVLSTPDKAWIKIDGRLYDERSPATLKSVAAGEHRLEAGLRDAYAEQSFSLDHREVLTVRLALQPNTLLLFDDTWQTPSALLERAVEQRTAGNLFTPEPNSAYALYRFLEREGRVRAEAAKGLDALFALLDEDLQRALTTSDVSAATRVVAQMRRYFPERNLSTRTDTLSSLQQRQAQAADDASLRKTAAEFARLLAQWRLESAAQALATLEKSSPGSALSSKLRAEYRAASARFRAQILQHSGALPRIVATKPLADFRIGAREVTFAQWDACVAERRCTSIPDDAGWGRGDRPVINVTFNQVTEEFLPWLQKKTGLPFRLPTEAEWEYAARAGSGARYYWGAGVDGTFANASQRRGWPADGQEFTAPVGSYAANAFGLYDTSGNVWEWTSDCAFKTTGNNAATRQSVRDCERRIVKGGSWFSPPDFLTPTHRADYLRFDKNNDRGFRVAVDY